MTTHAVIERKVEKGHFQEYKGNGISGLPAKSGHCRIVKSSQKVRRKNSKKEKIRLTDSTWSILKEVDEILHDKDYWEPFDWRRFSNRALSPEFRKIYDIKG